MAWRFEFVFNSWDPCKRGTKEAASESCPWTSTCKMVHAPPQLTPTRVTRITLSHWKTKGPHPTFKPETGKYKWSQTQLYIEPPADSVEIVD